MKSQMKRLGFAYDWSREVTTCLPEYYKLEPVVLPEAVREGTGLSQEEQGELVSGMRHGAGQRAGGGWLLLAA